MLPYYIRKNLHTPRNSSTKAVARLCYYQCWSKLLRQQFPDVGGLESTLTVAAKSCKTLSSGAIQIMHILSNHWICIKLNEDKTTVFLYDSKYSSMGITTSSHSKIMLYVMLKQGRQFEWGMQNLSYTYTC